MFSRVSPGQYLLTAHPVREAEGEGEQDEGTELIDVGDRDLKVDLPVAHPIKITGRVVLEDRTNGTKDGPNLPANLQPKLWPQSSEGHGGISPVHSADFVTVAADGSFASFAYFPPGGEIETVFASLPSGYYVREVRYNGRVSMGARFAISPAALSQEIEIACSNKAGAIRGVLRTADGEAVAQAHILAAFWPAEIISGYPDNVIETTTDSSGNFVLSRLSPGPYKIIGVTPDVRARLEEPNRLLNIFDSSKSVDVGQANSVVKDIALTTF